MGLVDSINGDIKKAMLSKQTAKLKALRAIKAALLLEQTSGSSKDISEDVALKILQKLVKQRKDSAIIYQENGREESAQEELVEAGYIEEYLPKQLSEGELKVAVEEIISQSGASSMADLGKVMGVATKQLAGKAEGRAIATMVKKLLG